MARFTATRIRKRFVTGSSTPVLVDTPGGAFVTKLRGSGHGVFALVAELVAGCLAERLGLAVPERALIDLEPDTPSDDKNDELADLIAASHGLNLGLRHLEGARDARAAELAATDDDTVARILWLDGLTQNPDRTQRNPNILIWNGGPWLIDHGSALGFHHDWAQLTEATPREPMDFTHHVFASRVALLSDVDATLGPMITRDALADAMSTVPDEFLAAVNASAQPDRTRALYQTFLWKRLKTPRPFSACFALAPPAAAGNQHSLAMGNEAALAPTGTGAPQPS